MRKTEYTNDKEILKYSDFTAIPVTFDATGINADAEGKKIVKAGTIVGGGFLKDRTKFGVVSTEAIAAEGVVLYDIDVTDGPKGGAVVVEGYIDLTKLPVAPTAAQETALKKITFME